MPVSTIYLETHLRHFAERFRKRLLKPQYPTTLKRVEIQAAKG